MIIVLSPNMTPLPLRRKDDHCPMSKYDPFASPQAAMRYGKDPMHRWAYRLSMRKPRNVSIVALARKMTTYAWHVLMGHPSPMKEAPKAFKTKMLKLATVLGRDHVRQAGFKNASAFVDALTEKVFGPPPAQLTGTELQTVSASGV